jgi:hypothetical protein
MSGGRAFPSQPRGRTSAAKRCVAVPQLHRHSRVTSKVRRPVRIWEDGPSSRSWRYPYRSGMKCRSVVFKQLVIRPFLADFDLRETTCLQNSCSAN